MGNSCKKCLQNTEQAALEEMKRISPIIQHQVNLALIQLSEEIEKKIQKAVQAELDKIVGPTPLLLR